MKMYKSKNPFTIREIDKCSSIPFIQKYHYSPVMPSITKHYLGFLADGGEITEETRIQSGNLHRQNKCQ